MTTKTDLSGTTKIGNEGIKKHFRSIEPWQPIFELAWNGFDAKATAVSVDIVLNELAAPLSVTVLDNGEGIDPRSLELTFGSFNDSHKRGDAAQHGAHGRGRLSFHRICRYATWHTRSSSGQARIAVDALTIKDYGAWAIADDEQCAALKRQDTGTLVQLAEFSSHLPGHAELKAKLSTEFGWHLALHPDHVLTLNGDPIPVPGHEITEHCFEWDDHRFDVQIIRWDERPSSEKSYTYLLDSTGRIVHKQLSTLNNKSGFYTSIYISSPWADSFAVEQNLLDPYAHTPRASEWKRLMRELGELTQELYERFLRRQARGEVEKYVEDGLFPTYAELVPEEREWRLSNAKELVTAIYVADPTVFNAASKKQRKIIIRLLDRLAVSNENDAIFDVLNSVLELDEQAVKTLADQLQQTSLENIVATIEILQRRHSAAAKLRALMNVHYREVLETPDLQQIIEANTWLFGPAYETLGAEEDSFTKIARTLRDRVPQIGVIDEEDVEASEDIAGAQRQTDLFLARRIPTLDSAGRMFYRCVIIEIKRPGIALNVKHLRQLDDYANIIKKHPEFSSEKMRFELILLGRKISSHDMEIESRMRQLLGRGELGLVSEDPRMKRYVLNWYTLLDAFELSNSFLLECYVPRNLRFGEGRLSRERLGRFSEHLRNQRETQRT
ncbi:ATP-binding protein [Cupriavidus oxalaticus]|uniref:DNA mismatch repair protein n=1 Tax=Cupriavidus oxalaticus TaxID=96344 RepID=A0A5P3VT92_9BURK|nr:ATP-binding protein [Cupriavidus oxalaticus]QEZ48019.1 DNA mismatch repair protein [Cupriavidus oxalaticus]